MVAPPATLTTRDALTDEFKTSVCSKSTERIKQGSEMKDSPLSSQTLSIKDALQRGPSIERLTYESIFRHRTSHLLCSSMPDLGYVHDDLEAREDQNDRVKWIAKVLQNVSQSSDANESAEELQETDFDSRQTYGYDDEPVHVRPSTDEDACRASPTKRRRVVRRNSFVIPRGRGLVPGLLDLQSQGKFTFGANSAEQE